MKNIALAEATDSRVVWQRLTDAIVADDDQAAADAKHEVCILLDMFIIITYNYVYTTDLLQLCMHVSCVTIT